MSQITIISGAERRRVWTDDQKRALVAAACEPGASVAEIARRADLRPSQLYRWRRDLAEPVSPGFAAVTVGASRHSSDDPTNRIFTPQKVRLPFVIPGGSRWRPPY